MSEIKTCILQTCAGGISARPLTKAFQDAGCDVIMGDMDISCLPKEQALKLPSPGQKEEYLKVLDVLAQEAAKEGKTLVVYPHNHDEAILVSKALYADNLWKQTQKNYIDWRALISSPVSILNTHNKLKLDQGLKEAGLPYQDVETIFRDKLFNVRDNRVNSVIEGEVLLKPVRGCGSNGIIKGFEEEYLCCRVFKNALEYTIDTLAYRGAVIDYCVRERVKSHGGICVDAMVLGHDEIFLDTLKKFVGYFNLQGPLAIQGFWEDKKFYITDCNHRFGGGVAMSIMAGWRGVDTYAKFVGDINGFCYAEYDIAQKHIRRLYIEEVVS